MTRPNHILIIDDDETMRDSCSQILSDQHQQLHLAENGRQGLDLMQHLFFDIVILDLKMPGLNGMEVLKKIKDTNPESIVIVITGYATIDSAVEAIKNGAYDFLPKPFTPDELRIIVKRAIENRKLHIENLYLYNELETSTYTDVIIGQSEAMYKIHNLIKKVGPTESTVLITGESGTGKELVARSIHRHSKRYAQPFVTVDCSTLVENLFESELFGHVKGSFTGANTTKYGRLEIANGGTIFFDEISNISTNIQAKLLRAIQEREITKVGSTQIVKMDIRIIAATNKDLKQAIEEKTFREDLFYRLSVVPIQLPSLRDRKNDIPLLANYFVEKYNQKRRKAIKGISEKAIAALTNYDWPGNVRELENAIERAIVLTDNEFIKPSDLFYYGLSVNIDCIKEKTLADIEKDHIIKMLKMYHSHLTKTATILDIDRKTLRMKMKKYGIGSKLEE